MVNSAGTQASTPEHILVCSWSQFVQL